MPTLLYLDDSLEVLALRAASLRLAGFSVSTCNTPWLGLATLATHNFDVIVTDYDMPDLNGYVFADHARANGYTRPIVMCTASLDLPRERGRSVDLIITKVSHPSALANALHGCLHKRSRPYSGCYSADAGSLCVAPPDDLELIRCRPAS